MPNNDIKRAGELAGTAARAGNAGFLQRDIKPQTAGLPASSDQARIAAPVRQVADSIERLTETAKAAGGIGNRFMEASRASGSGNSEALRESLQAVSGILSEHAAHAGATGQAAAPVAGHAEAASAIRGAGNHLAETADAFAVGNSGALRRAIESVSRPPLSSPQQSESDKRPATATPLLTAEDLGRAVRANRKKRGLSQQRFADLAGVGRRFLSELEHGKETLELGKALKVARMAGIDIEMNSE